MSEENKFETNLSVDPVGTPNTPPIPVTPPPTPITSPTPTIWQNNDERKKRKKIILVVVLVLFFVFVTSFVLYLSDREKPLVPLTDEPPVSELEIYPDLNPDDLDRDGITNDEEESLGLSPLEYDTDRDGISDKEEIDYWKTDPKKVDTDGDGFADGYEVMNGYNPLGAGELTLP